MEGMNGNVSPRELYDSVVEGRTTCKAYKFHIDQIPLSSDGERIYFCGRCATVYSKPDGEIFSGLGKS